MLQPIGGPKDMTRENAKYASAVKSYGTRGTQVRSAEGSAIGRSPAGAADARSLARSGAARVAKMRSNSKF